MRTLSFFLLLAVSLVSWTARADYIRAFLPGVGASVGAAAFDQPAHILLSGVGDEVGTEIQRAAVTRALKYRDMDPRASVFLIAFIEAGYETNAARLKKVGFTEIQRVKRAFVDRNVISEMRAFTQIRSLDLFSHNSPHYGLQLESKYSRLAPDSPGLEKLKANFLPEAYGMIHGCNSGWIVAPTFSRRMGIPFAGSFTSTDFEYLNTDGQYYQRNKGQFPATAFEKTNALSFLEEKDCSYGGCTRMKPDNSPYYGSWGVLSGGGLNIYKFFCPGIGEKTCLKAMARSLFAFPSTKVIDQRSSLEDYRLVLKDFLCPSQKKGARRSACSDELDAYEKTGKRTQAIYSGREVQCDFKGCQAKVICDRDAEGNYLHGTCKVVNASPKTVTTREEEYLSYLKGFQLLQAE